MHRKGGKGIMTHEAKLKLSWNHFHEGLTFEEFLVKESERELKKAIQMSGDLGEAYGKIAELQSKIKELNKALEVMENENK